MPASLRIASLVPSLTELLFDLGLGNQVVARTGYCIHPAPAVNAVPKVGGTKQVNINKLRRLAPTHVVLNREENTREVAEVLSSFIPNLVVTHPAKFADNLALFDQFASEFDCVEKARELGAALKEQIRLHLLPAAPNFRKLRVLYVIWKDPWMTISPDTYIADVLGQVGLEVMPAQQLGLDADRPYPIFHADQVRHWPLDAILLSSEPYAFQTADIEPIKLEFGLNEASIPVILVDGELLSWYGSRSLKTPAYLAGLRARLTE